MTQEPAKNSNEKPCTFARLSRLHAVNKVKSSKNLILRSELSVKFGRLLMVFSIPVIWRHWISKLKLSERNGFFIAILERKTKNLANKNVTLNNTTLHRMFPQKQKD